MAGRNIESWNDRGVFGRDVSGFGEIDGQSRGISPAQRAEKSQVKFVKGKVVVIRRTAPIIGDIKGSPCMDGKSQSADEGDIVVGIEAEFPAEIFAGCEGASVDGDSIRRTAQDAVQHGPDSGHGFVLVPVFAGPVIPEQPEDVPVKFGMIVFGAAGGKTRIIFDPDNTIGFDSLKSRIGLRSLAQERVPPLPDEAPGLVDIFPVYGVHFRELHGFPAEAPELGLQKRCGGESPTCSGFSLGNGRKVEQGRKFGGMARFLNIRHVHGQDRRAPLIGDDIHGLIAGRERNGSLSRGSLISPAGRGCGKDDGDQD